MKTKTCELYKVEETTLFRIQIQKGKTWIFVCETCCNKSKTSPITVMVALGKVIDID